MSKNNLIELHCFGKEIGKLGYDEGKATSYFQYNAAFLKEEQYRNMFPLIFKRTPMTQVFGSYNNDTFRGLPPMIADSLPDAFGNIIFRAWMEGSAKRANKISVLEQLAYVGRRGMGALEYIPAKDMPANKTIDIDEITAVVATVLDNKNAAKQHALDHASLLNIFKIGTSAGGARPKILVSQSKATGEIIPGDLEYSAAYDHYLVKLNMEQEGYNREVVEYLYYETAVYAGINMMPSKLIDGKHFATLRFDRQDGKKLHVLTATGMTGWDYAGPKVSSYENLFSLAAHLKLQHSDIEQLFRRMIFNIVFANHDDHLKNHSFIYSGEDDKWQLAPAYDITYSLNPLLAYKRYSRALSINGKRMDINRVDVLTIAEQYTIKNPAGIINDICKAIPTFKQNGDAHSIPEAVIDSIVQNFNAL